MPLWQTPDVLDQPDITLIRWRILEITEGPLTGQRHLNGYCRENREGRASTQIVSFDPRKKICVTKSGRRYHLFGPSGFDSDGDYVWQIWSRRTPTIDVSQEYQMHEINREGLPEVLNIVIGSVIHGSPYEAINPVIRYTPSSGWCICSKEDVRHEDAVDIDIKLFSGLIDDDVKGGTTGAALARSFSDDWIREKLLTERTWPRLRDLPPDEQALFDEWLTGRTVPAIDGLPPEEQDAYYPWDYELWKDRRTRERI